MPLEARITHHDRDGIPLEKLKLTRGITPVSFAVAHVACWKQVVIDAHTQPMIPGAAMAASYHHMIEAASARLTLWSSLEPSICSRLTDASIIVDRCIIFPIYHEQEIMALVLDEGFFGAPCMKSELVECSATLALESGLLSAINLVNVTMNSLEGKYYVFSAVARTAPSAAGSLKCRDVGWRTITQIRDVEAYAYAALAMRRELQIR